MEFKDVLAKRRAVREYSDKPVDQTTIERLIHAAILAPSAFNAQPWAFAALLDRERIDAYAERAKEWLLANFAIISQDESIRKMLEGQYTLFHHAPALVLVMAKSSESQAAEDCCLAAENLMLAARDEGLGTCWIGFARPWLNLQTTKYELGLADNYQVVAPIVLGYPQAWPGSHGRSAPEILWL